MRYYANFNANNGTRFINPITDTNKARLIKRIRQTAAAERFKGNTASWYVWYEDKSFYKPCYVAAGVIYDWGYGRYNKDELKYL